VNAVALFTFSAVLLFMLSLRKREPKGIEKFVRGINEDQALLESTTVTERRTRTSWLSRLEEDAARAGLTVSTRSLLLLAVLGSAAGFTVLFSLSNSLVFGLAGLVFGAVLPKRYINRLKKRRAEAFQAQFNQALSILSSSLRAGSSLEQALKRVAEDAPSPVREEFKRVVQQIRLGQAPEDAVKELKRRIDCPEVDVFVIATQILARTGGNMAEIYDLLGQMVAERKAFRQAVRSYTAQARVSAYVVSIIPVLVTAAIYLRNPAYFTPMTSSISGRVLLWGCFGMIACGWWVISKMIQVSLD